MRFTNFLRPQMSSKICTVLRRVLCSTICVAVLSDVFGEFCAVLRRVLCIVSIRKVVESFSGLVVQLPLAQTFRGSNRRKLPRIQNLDALSEACSVAPPATGSASCIQRADVVGCGSCRSDGGGGSGAFVCAGRGPGGGGGGVCGGRGPGGVGGGASACAGCGQRCTAHNAANRRGRPPCIRSGDARLHCDLL